MTMNNKSYVTPDMTEYQLLSEQSFLAGSGFGQDNHAGNDMNENIWGDF